jgi:hypothetical protein
MLLVLAALFPHPPLGPFTPVTVGTAIGWLAFQALLVGLLCRRPAEAGATPLSA